jgi:hypothetical protein
MGLYKKKKNKETEAKTNKKTNLLIKNHTSNRKKLERKVPNLSRARLIKVVSLRRMLYSICDDGKRTKKVFITSHSREDDTNTEI